MYLALMLIVVAILVFYNELNSKMNIAEYLLLAISLIAIIRAAINYIKIDSIREGFTSENVELTEEINKKAMSYNNNISKPIKSTKNNVNKLDETDEADEADEVDEKYKADKVNKQIIMNSEESSEYLDSDEKPDTNLVNRSNDTFDNSDTNLNKITNDNMKSESGINKINELLGISSNSNINNSIRANFENIDSEENSEIKSVFNPKVIIGKGGFGSDGDSNNWNSSFENDGMTFDNTMAPRRNLWRDNHSFLNDGSNKKCNKNDSDDDWTQNLDDYNKGKWSRKLYNRPSDYVDYYTPKSYGTSTPSSESEQSDQTKKLCGPYNSIDESDAGDLIVKNYSQAKKWYPGYTYVPPSNWDVPQRHISICNPAGPNVRKLTGLVDRGLPINVLELNPDGSMADNEDDVNLTNIGSMMPKFNYQEQPFSKPYI